jgi:alpha-beta hydrolase superfamily lysophospholipase
MPFFDGAAGRIFYRHWTFTEDPAATLVFLHGFGEHSGLYHRFAAELGRHGIDLWALDQPGHGLSDGTRGDVGSFTDIVTNARTLTALAVQHGPHVPLVIAGHSLGSVGALLTALEDTDRYRAVVISGAALDPLPWLTETDSAQPFSLELDALSADPTYRDELVNDALAFTEADVVGVLSRLFPPAWRRLDAELPELRLPILAVHGQNDAIAPLTGILGWRDRLPQLRVEVIDSAAHDVLNEVAHRRVADLIAAHALTQHTPATVDAAGARLPK